MDTKLKSAFGVRCRALRISKVLKQREVAAAIGVKLSTYGNVESSRWKVINRDKAMKLAAFYRLSPADTAALLTDWEACPLSPGGEKRREVWKRTNEFRSKARNHDKLKAALVDLLGVHLMALPDAELCSCEFGEPTCPLCTSLERLGLDAYNPADRERLLARLAKLQEQLAAPPAAEVAQ